MNARARAAFTRLGVDIDPGRPARGLSVADQQIVEIAKAISFDARVIVMDEPTAALTLVEVDRLFDVVESLVRRGGGGAVHLAPPRGGLRSCASGRPSCVTGASSVRRRSRTSPSTTSSVRWSGATSTRCSPRPRPNRARSSWPWTGSLARACSRTSPSRSVAARSSRWRVLSAPAAARWPERSSGWTAAMRARSPYEATRCRTVPRGRRWLPAWRSSPRTGGSRDWSWTWPSTTTSPSPRSPTSGSTD